MGLPGPSVRGLEDLDKRFSDDILKIELSGPKHHHLSVFEVSGLHHSKYDQGPHFEVLFITISWPNEPSYCWFHRVEDGILSNLVQGRSWMLEVISQTKKCKSDFLDSL